MSRLVPPARLSRVRHLALAYANGLPGPLDLFPNLKSIRVLDGVYCRWTASDQGRDLTGSDDVKAAVKEMIRKRGAPEWLDWNSLSMRCMMNLAESLPQLKIYGHVEMRIIHFNGDGLSEYWIDVDFTERKLRVLNDIVEHRDRKGWPPGIYIGGVKRNPGQALALTGSFYSAANILNMAPE